MDREKYSEEKEEKIYTYINSNIKTNITPNIISFIEEITLKCYELMCNKLRSTINFISDNNIIIVYVTNIRQKNICIYLYKDNEEIGRFEISNFGEINNMSIYVDDENNIYRNKGLSRLMIASMIYVLKYEIKNFSNLILHSGVLLHIDADSSEGFWSSIGMEETRLYKRRDRGYEKDITLGQLEKWCFGNVGVLFTFGGNQNKKYKTKKSKTKKSKTKKLKNQKHKTKK